MLILQVSRPSSKELNLFWLDLCWCGGISAINKRYLFILILRCRYPSTSSSNKNLR